MSAHFILYPLLAPSWGFFYMDRNLAVHETLTAKAIHSAPYITGVPTVIMGLTQEEWMVTGVIVGIVCTIITTAVNIWFKRQEHKHPTPKK